MSRKHHTRHHRTPGGYQRRLEARGLSRAPLMTPWDQVSLEREKKREERRRDERRKINRGET